MAAAPPPLESLDSPRILRPLLRLLGLTTEALFELSLTFNLTGGLRSSGSLESSCLILLLRGLLNLLLSTEIELEAVVAEFEPLAVGNLSNLTSHFLAAVGQTTPPVMMPIILHSFLRSSLDY